ncbi:hypothetical protein VC116063_003201 [Vibrio cholerae O1 str. 116063]|nr:hypothetical protein VC116063_003201 [Vibrio cholerae O1 str. 116063]
MKSMGFLIKCTASDGVSDLQLRVMGIALKKRLTASLKHVRR